MDDLISRAAAIDAVYYKPSYKMAIEVLKKVPAVDAVPVVHAYWIDCSDYNDGTVCRKCSACNDMQIHYNKYYPNYCPECGARMDGDT